MLIPVPPSECMRAREAASGLLDGELSELEAIRLDIHLRRCPSCREFAAQAAAFTDELRHAPLEVLAVPAFEPRRRRHASALRVQAAAAAAAVAGVALVGASVLGHVLGGGARPGLTSTASAGDAASLRNDALEQRLIALRPAPRDVAMRNAPVVPL
jgi:predicted anti-sigma-YlaC factor YlaD